MLKSLMTKQPPLASVVTLTIHCIVFMTFLNTQPLLTPSQHFCGGLCMLAGDHAVCTQLTSLFCVLLCHTLVMTILELSTLLATLSLHSVYTQSPASSAPSVYQGTCGVRSNKLSVPLKTVSHNSIRYSRILVFTTPFLPPSIDNNTAWPLQTYQLCSATVPVKQQSYPIIISNFNVLSLGYLYLSSHHKCCWNSVSFSIRKEECCYGNWSVITHAEYWMM